MKSLMTELITRFKNNLQTRIMAFLLVVALIPLILIVIVAYLQASNALRDAALTEFSFSNQISERNVQNFLQQFETDVLNLSEMPSIQGFIRAYDNAGMDPQTDISDEAWLNQINQTFIVLAQNKPFYQQLRYLDETGQEIARVNFKDEKVIPVVAQDLQNKADHPYFIETIKYGLKEIYISELNLNQEGGQIEEPHVPVIHFATPVFDEDGNLHGIIVANVYAATFLNQLHDELDSQVYLTNKEGYYLHHPDSTYEFGFDLGTDFNAYQDFNWSLSQLGNQHSYVEIDSASNRVIAIEKILFDQANSNRYWILIRSADEADVLKNINTFILIMFVLLVVLTLLIVGAAIRIAQSITKPLKLLVNASEKLADGDWHVPLPKVGNDEIGQLANSFSRMATHIRQSLESLEDRIQERVKFLETSAAISGQINLILDIDELLQFIINRIWMDFDLYHAHIYLIEPESGDLVMVEGSGEVGRQLKEDKHRLEAGRGIVGTVASTNQHFLSNNVNEVLNFVRNKYLPETNSELAVPLRKGQQVLGVLDVQSTEIDRFSEEDVNLIQSLANQVAVAIDNARLLSQAQHAVREVERLNSRLTGEAWEGFVEESPTTGYRFVGGEQTEVMADSKAWLHPMQEAAKKQMLVKHLNDGNGQTPKTEIAVPLIVRGQVIGALGVQREKSKDWAEDEVTAVQTVASQVSRALENARLSKEQEKTIVQLKEVDRLKSEFLTSMSHELRTPLNSIIGFADILLQGIDGPLSDNALMDITAIHNSGKHLLALINDILDLSKIEAGRMELARAPLSMNQMFTEVTSSVSSLLTDKPIEIIHEIEPDAPLVWADSLRLSQVLINLVSNAIKFTEEGSVTLGAVVEGDFMHLYVRDTGIGIPADKIDIVFEHFRQVDSRVAKKYQGTGMGLAIARQLAELHGGHMWLESVINVGSTFHFTIPLAEAKQK